MNEHTKAPHTASILHIPGDVWVNRTQCHDQENALPSMSCLHVRSHQCTGHRYSTNAHRWIMGRATQTHNRIGRRTKAPNSGGRCWYYTAHAWTSPREWSKTEGFKSHGIYLHQGSPQGWSSAGVLCEMERNSLNVPAHQVLLSVSWSIHR